MNEDVKKFQELEANSKELQIKYDKDEQGLIDQGYFIIHVRMPGYARTQSYYTQSVPHLGETIKFHSKYWKVDHVVHDVDWRHHDDYVDRSSVGLIVSETDDPYEH